jgi:hypothetical protein
MKLDLKTMLAFAAATLAAGGWVAYAEEQHKQVRSNVEQIQLLTDIHEVQLTEAQRAERLRIAEDRFVRELCRLGELDRESERCKAVEAD